MKNWKKNFFTIWIGQAFSMLSSSVLQFAIVWYLTDKTGSAAVLTASLFFGFVPRAVLGPFIGSLIDRYSRKKIMILSDLFIAAACFSLVIVGMFGEISVWIIMLILGLRSIGSAFHEPSLQAVTPMIVPSDELVRCSGYSKTLESISQILSPAIAAILYSNWSLNIIIFLDVIGAGIAVFSLIISNIPELEKKEQTEKPNVFRETKEGFMLLKSNKGIMGLVMVGSLYTLALMPISALFPLMSMSYFGGTAGHASVVEVAFSIGLLIGSIIISIWGGSKNKIHTIVFSYLLMSFALITTWFLPATDFAFNIFIGMSFLMGVSGPFYWSIFHPLLQSSFKEEYLGRIMTLSSSISMITAPVALVSSGALSEIFGVKFWFIFAGILTAILAFVCMLSPNIRESGKQNII